MALVIKNNAKGLLQSAISAGATSTTIQAGHNMPALAAGDYCFGTFVSTANTVEVVRVTAIVGNVLTHGATTNAFSAGDRFELRPCKELLDSLAQEASAKYRVVLAGTDTYTGTASPVPVAYASIAWLLQFPNANTVAAPTVNLNGLGAKVVKNRDGAALVAGQIKAGSWHVGYYDGTNFNLVTLPTESAGASLVLLATPVLAAGTLDQNSIFSTTYDCFELTFTDVTVSNNGAELWLRISQGGATRSGAADYAHVRTAADSTPAVAAAGLAADSKILLAAGISNVAGVALSGKIWFFGPGGTTTQKRINSKLSYTSNTPALVNIDGAGCYVGTTSGSPTGALDGFHLSASVGTITGGSFTLHALKKT